MDKCQFCRKEIDTDAIICIHCNQFQLSEHRVKQYRKYIVESKSPKETIEGIVYFIFLIFLFTLFVDGKFLMALGIFFGIGIAGCVIDKIFFRFERMKLREVEELNIIDLKEDYLSYKRKRRIRTQIYNCFIAAMCVGLLSSAILFNPTESQFKEYYNYTEDSDGIISVYRENHIIYSIFRVRTNSGEERRYEGFFWNMEEK